MPNQAILGVNVNGDIADFEDSAARAGLLEVKKGIFWRQIELNPQEGMTSIKVKMSKSVMSLQFIGSDKEDGSPWFFWKSWYRSTTTAWEVDFSRTASYGPPVEVTAEVRYDAGNLLLEIRNFSDYVGERSGWVVGWVSADGSMPKVEYL